ncbi:hypothetical protein [Pyrococcus horikoshii]|uniref:Uncharacterized protein n=1 Tax=Pyrococcus horikoshii TaxID=53953 RepID=A0A832W794_PYRHR|nr:hypothetical protein [Pyrococcus horikoshii]HII60693.1 hypothetical protein [Pyrococcus horikoshii]
MLKLKPEPMIVKFRKVEVKIESQEENKKELVNVKLITNVKRVQLS